MPPLEIRTPRTIIRSFTPADADELFACITPTLTRFMSWEPPASLDAFADVWRDWLDLAEAGRELQLIVRAAADGTFVGIIGLHDMQGDTPELGLWIREDRHGQGFGAEALTAVTAWAADRLRPRAFVYPVAEPNIASRRLAERLGGTIVEQRATSKYASVVYHIPVPRTDPTIDAGASSGIRHMVPSGSGAADDER